MGSVYLSIRLVVLSKCCWAPGQYLVVAAAPENTSKKLIGCGWQGSSLQDKSST